MSAACLPSLLTVDEFDRVPDAPGGLWELHHGEAVFVTFPKRRHKDLQWHLRNLLQALAPGFLVETEYPYRPLPEHELWGADVALLPRSRHEQAGDWLMGSPDLVIGIRSRSDTKDQLHDKAMTTLAGEGSAEFWIVDPNSQAITVYTRVSGMHVYGPGSAVPVPVAGRPRLPVDEVLAPAS